MLRIALNGYGRIGRALVRALFERGLDQRLRIEAINDLGDFESLAHLTRFDSTFGRFPGHVHLSDDRLQVNNQTIHLLRERDPVNLPWAQLGVDLVLECTGKMKKRAQVEQHLTAGAPRVLLSHPLDTADLTVVYGVNHEQLGSQQIVSNASCTTNCLAPLAMLLHREVGIRSGLVTTVHAYTNDQHLLDKSHSDPYRARAAAVSMIPTSTGAAKAIGLVLPELAGRLDGMAIRVPTPNVSLLDFSFIAERPTSREALNAALEAGVTALPPGVMECNALPLVSSDFNGYPVSCVVDLNHTRVQGELVKVLAWYDNEWAFANRMLDVVLAWLNP
ncbi:type I glyceraldehyde-3-phosphate dehydrogenase [Pseudomonas sp. BN414]|uniref:type I glyceraldehyde-3-phosphate dehydrogenase n=1 Tax=Pseudomonadaceae TaxID=135621 RepID=UPI000985C545|nr:MULTISPECIES: type I glyceraldehyde-3-phosphate dehydrogenase [Pseudomonas]MDH4566781.1 type I glyceraldehyde-3-phosphate dehydrogenase [Pseudomonas sp. BN414]GLZ87844.1 glyceraldehyde-3-phosphate dehydrogenase [Pseudomonas resinovorans]